MQLNCLERSVCPYAQGVTVRIVDCTMTLQCRYTLKYTYPFAYYSEGSRKDLVSDGSTLDCAIMYCTGNGHP